LSHTDAIGMHAPGYRL